MPRLAKVVRKYNIKTIYFQDDNFCLDLKRLKGILEGIIKEKLNIKWGTLGLRVDTAKQMGKEILLTSARVIPEKLLDNGFTFQHETLFPALRDMLGR